MNLQPSTPDPLIQLRDVVKTYKSTAGELTALKSITADFFSG